MADPRIEPFVTKGLGDSTYLIASGDEAAIVDPQRDAARFVHAASSRGLRIKVVLETHVHNDYVSGALEVREATGASLVLPARGGYGFDHRGAAEGDEVRIGDLTLRAWETPGHTPEHLAWIATADGAGEPFAAFTGGSLMVASAGRTDLLGPDLTEELTEAQFASLSRIGALPAATLVMPTHGAGSFCGSAGASVRRTSTVGEERRSNPALAFDDAQAFVADRLSGLLEYPAYYRHMAPTNRAGPALLRCLPRTTSTSPDAAASAVVSGATVVDGRDRRSFAGGHVPGSLNIELDDQFCSYVGWIVPWSTPLVLVLPESAGSLEEAVTQLRRIGFDAAIGHLAGGIDAWHASGRPVASYPAMAAAALGAALDASGPTDGTRVLDVRQPAEWAEGILAGSRTIFVGDLPSRVGEVPNDRETWVVCRTGHRAAIAASILEAAGVPVRLVAEGGVPDLLAEAAPRGALGGSPGERGT